MNESTFVQPPVYSTLLHAYLRRPLLRIAVCTPFGCRLLLLPSTATLNDAYRQLDTPREAWWLHLPNGRAAPRTDEFLGHYLQRMQQQPYQRKPQVYRLLAVALPVLNLPFAPAGIEEPQSAAPAAVA